MSVEAMQWVWKNGPSDMTERMVLLAIADHADEDGRGFPSMVGIAEKTCMTERGARGVVRRLEAGGWLKTEIGGGRGGKSVYTVLMKNPEPQTRNIDATRNHKPGMTFPEKAETRNVATRNPEGDCTKPGTSVPPNHQGTIKEPSNTSTARQIAFSRFWAAYPKRVEKKGAQAKFEAAVKSGVDPERIISAAEAYAKSDNVRRGFAKHPTTWLNAGCWDDEQAAAPIPQQDPAQAQRADFLRKIANGGRQ